MTTSQFVDSNKPKPTQASSLSDWLSYMHQIHVSAIDMGLSRVLPVAEYLDIVQSAKDDAYVLTVAGTNGKGSTTATVAEICQQAGYKVALYQSPHLMDFNERVRINGEPVDDAVLTQAFAKVESARLACDLTLSFFEMTTLSAMLIFAEADCDIWVLEVGLGGRLDVVNIIDPYMAVITNVGIDHVDWLGDTREKIGFEKAGILRQGIPVVYGEADMPQSVRERMTELNCICYQVTQDYAWFDDDLQEQVWRFSSRAVTLELPKPKLSLVNSANAVAAVLASGLPITQKHIEAGLKAVKLAGRFDYRELANRHWLFDVAHNVEGVRFLLNGFMPFWQRHVERHPTAKLHLLFSMLGDKDVYEVVNLLSSSSLPIEAWHIAQIDHPRAMPLSELIQTVQNVLLQPRHVDITTDVLSYTSFDDAVNNVMEATTAHDFILTCGSFHTIGEVFYSLFK